MGKEALPIVAKLGPSVVDVPFQYRLPVILQGTKKSVVHHTQDLKCFHPEVTCINFAPVDCSEYITWLWLTSKKA